MSNFIENRIGGYGEYNLIGVAMPKYNGFAVGKPISDPPALTGENYGPMQTKYFPFDITVMQADLPKGCLLRISRICIDYNIPKENLGQGIRINSTFQYLDATENRRNAPNPSDARGYPAGFYTDDFSLARFNLVNDSGIRIIDNDFMVGADNNQETNYYIDTLNFSKVRIQGIGFVDSCADIAKYRYLIIYVKICAEILSYENAKKVRGGCYGN